MVCYVPEKSEIWWSFGLWSKEMCQKYWLTYNIYLAVWYKQHWQLEMFCECIHVTDEWVTRKHLYGPDQHLTSLSHTQTCHPVSHVSCSGTYMSAYLFCLSNNRTGWVTQFYAQFLFQKTHKTPRQSWTHRSKQGLASHGGCGYLCGQEQSSQYWPCYSTSSYLTLTSPVSSPDQLWRMQWQLWCTSLTQLISLLLL